MALITLEEYLEKIEELTADNRPDQVVNHCLYLLRQFPKYISLYEKLGHAYLDINRRGDSLNVYARLCTASPENVLYHVTTAYLLKESGQEEAAVEHCRTAIDLQPGNSDISRELIGWLDLGTEDIDFTSPESTEFSKGVLAFQSKKYNKALRHFEKAESYRDHFLLEQFRALALFYTGDTARAMPIIGNLLEESPYDLSLLKAEAVYQVDRDKRGFARTIEKLCELDPYFAHWEINGNEITPSSFDIPVIFFDWTGFPKTRVRYGWQQAREQIIRDETQSLPKWLDLLPADSARVIPGNEANRIRVTHYEKAYRQSFFRSIAAEIKPEELKPEPEQAPKSNELDDAFSYLEQVAAEGIRPEEETPPEPQPQLFPEVETVPEEVIPEPDEEQRKRMRDAWRAFSMGKADEGVQLYRALLADGLHPSLLREDLEKLVILFPDNEELASLNGSCVPGASETKE